MPSERKVNEVKMARRWKTIARQWQDDRKKAAGKREQNGTRSNYAERKQARLKVKRARRQIERNKK